MAGRPTIANTHAPSFTFKANTFESPLTAQKAIAKLLFHLILPHQPTLTAPAGILKLPLKT